MAASSTITPGGSLRNTRVSSRLSSVVFCCFERCRHGPASSFGIRADALLARTAHFVTERSTLAPDRSVGSSRLLSRPTAVGSLSQHRCIDAPRRRHHARPNHGPSSKSASHIRRSSPLMRRPAARASALSLREPSSNGHRRTVSAEQVIVEQSNGHRRTVSAEHVTVEQSNGRRRPSSSAVVVVVVCDRRWRAVTLSSAVRRIVEEKTTTREQRAGPLLTKVQTFRSTPFRRRGSPPRRGERLRRVQERTRERGREGGTEGGRERRSSRRLGAGARQRSVMGGGGSPAPGDGKRHGRSGNSNDAGRQGGARTNNGRRASRSSPPA